MASNFDWFGWYTEDPQYSNRIASTIGSPGTPVIGDPYPMWTGYNWTMIPYTAPPPPVELPKHITLLALNLRMTRAERDAIRAAEIANPDVSDVMYLMRQARYIDLARPETIGGLNMLEAAGLIGVGRANVILALPIQIEERI